MKRMGRIGCAVVLSSVLAISAGSPALAEGGDVTSTAFTQPAGTDSLSPEGAFSDGRGGLYHLYTNSSTLSVYRSDADGVFDTSFGTSGVATASIVNAESLRYRLSSAPVSGDAWIAATNSSSANVIISMSGAGVISVNSTPDASAIASQCSTDYPTSVAGGGVTFLDVVGIRPDGKVWAIYQCWVNSSDSMESRARYAVVVGADGAIDGTVGIIDLDDDHGSSSTCSSTSNIATDPTAADGAPSLLVTRILHAALNAEGTCVAMGRPNANTAVDATYTGLDHLRIAADGTVTRTELAVPAGTPSLLVGRQFQGYSIIDPGGRLLVTVSDLTDLSSVSLMRILPDGTLDATLGTGGLLDLGSFTPVGSSATNVALGIDGLITTADEVLLSMSIRDSFGYSCSGNVDLSAGYRMGVLSIADGWLAGWGNDGIGDSVALTRVNFPVTACPITLYGGAGVDADGQPRLITYEQDGSALYHVWESVSGVTGGSAGGTGTGGYTSDTGGAPSAGDGLSTVGTTTTTTSTTTTTTTVAETTTTVADTTTTTEADPAEVALPATGNGDSTSVAIAVVLLAAGALITLRRRAV